MFIRTRPIRPRMRYASDGKRSDVVTPRKPQAQRGGFFAGLLNMMGSVIFTDPKDAGTAASATSHNRSSPSRQENGAGSRGSSPKPPRLLASDKNVSSGEQQNGDRAAAALSPNMDTPTLSPEVGMLMQSAADKVAAGIISQSEYDHIVEVRALSKFYLIDR